MSYDLQHSEFSTVNYGPMVMAPSPGLSQSWKSQTSFPLNSTTLPSAPVPVNRHTAFCL